MRTQLRRIWMVGIVLFTVGCAVLPLKKENKEVAFYVSTDGNDAWSGTDPTANREKTDGPFATLERARDALRSLKQSQEELRQGGRTVYLRGGAYPIANSFQLTADDTGTQNSPITYRAYKNETVVLLGGRDISGFKPITDPSILARIDNNYRQNILQVDLKAQGITDYGKITARGFGRPISPAGLEIFFQNKPMTLARWPNQGWIQIAGAPDGKKGATITYTGDRPRHWLHAQDIWLHGYWTWDWADSYVKVQRIDLEKRALITCKPYGVYGYTPGKRFYALNILEELDQPGEWYLDRKTGILYFWPPAPIHDGKSLVSLLESPMISMQDVSYVTIRGLTLECTRGNGIEITGGSHNLIAGCTLRNIGNAAVQIRGGTENGVQACDIYETGDGGIYLSGGDRQTLIPANNYATNNHIHHYSRWCRTYRPAVMVSGVGNRVTHNLIHDAPHTAIQLSGNDHLIEFNEIHGVCQETGDVGAFYMGRDWTMRGTVIRYNYFHDIHGPYKYGAMAVYLDDSASGITIFGNVFYQASRAAFIGGGRDNVVENNIFVECNPAVHIDARCLGWAKKSAEPGGVLQKRLRAVPYNQPPYSTRYPKLGAILDEEPAVPKGNRIIRNVAYKGKWLELQGVKESWVYFQDNLIDTDPGFVDPEHLDFQLREDSPAYKIGFKRIPIDKIGLYPDAYRNNQ